VVPEPGAEVHGRWLAELAALGYRDRDRPVQLALPLPGMLDRDAATGQVLARLGAARLAWNRADVRGEVEQFLARQSVVTDPAVRLELAEDLAAGTLALCVRLRDRCQLPAVGRGGVFDLAHRWVDPSARVDHRGAPVRAHGARHLGAGCGIRGAEPGDARQRGSRRGVRRSRGSHARANRCEHSRTTRPRSCAPRSAPTRPLSCSTCPISLTSCSGPGCG
jgi:hypothetical protein